MRALSFVLLAMVGCRDDGKDTGIIDSSDSVALDDDGDGFVSPEDCDDADATASPAAYFP